ncbi:HEPN/Toprim-associated domain-containing protein [Pseudoalteromonas sp. SSMSWG5]|uniref:HEPN/Toprim-associated domain-containing protein n=1 Tax=Pseudoalteromonas sp. SSMSWG5 TaxID=3139396 RepID=UPI003BA8D0E1
MGSVSLLDVGSFELECSNGEYYNNHSKLFIPSDYGVIKSEMDEGVLREEMGHARSLGDMKLRLELLGYTINDAQRAYENVLSHYFDDTSLDGFTFENFRKVVSSVNIEDLDPFKDSFHLSFHDYIAEAVLTQSGFEDIKDQVTTNIDDFMALYSRLHPYFLLRLFAENPKNQHLKVMWQTHEIVEAGWVSNDDLYTGVDEKDKFLIITEGSSDLFIIKHAISLLRPELADLFTYVDMEDNYPFSGTGNQYKFFQGLASIGMQNKCLCIFDNDAEGVEKYHKAVDIKAPSNLKVMKLPDLAAFSDFVTEGPTGRHNADVNGKAVAIECFLDLAFKERLEPVIRWSSRKGDANVYQGALENKDYYIKQFKKVKSMDEPYDFSKLNLLIDRIIEVCVS